MNNNSIALVSEEQNVLHEGLKLPPILAETKNLQEQQSTHSSSMSPLVITAIVIVVIFCCCLILWFWRRNPTQSVIEPGTALISPSGTAKIEVVTVGGYWHQL